MRIPHTPYIQAYASHPRFQGSGFQPALKGRVPMEEMETVENFLKECLTYHPGRRPSAIHVGAGFIVGLALLNFWWSICRGAVLCGWLTYMCGLSGLFSAAPTTCLIFCTM